MGSILYCILTLSCLLWWDITDKILMLISWKLVYRKIYNYTASRSRFLFVLARVYTDMNIIIDIPQELLRSQMTIVSNHQSFMDIPLILSVFHKYQIRFIAKAELSHGLPAISQTLRVLRHPLINRAKPLESFRIITKFARNTTGNVCPTVFPEGTRSRTSAVNPYLPGALWILRKACSLPLLIIAVDVGRKYRNLIDLMRLKRHHTIRLSAVQLIEPAKNKHKFMEQIESAQQKVAHTLQQWKKSNG